MRHILTLLCLFACLNAVGQTMYPGGISGCVGRWPFGNPEVTTNILYDMSGNSNSGTPTNITATTGWRGQANTAGKFDGTSSNGLVKFAPNLNLSQLTMIALIKFDGFYSGNCQANMIFSRGNGTGAGVYSMNVTDAVYDGQNCSSFDAAHQMRSDYVGTAVGMSPPLTPPIQTGQWYFFAGTFDGYTYTAYQVAMDSTLPLTSVSPLYRLTGLSPMGTNSDDLYLGMGVNPAYRYYFNGSMDELALFNRALDSQEVFKIFNSMRKAPISTTGIGIANTSGTNADIVCYSQAGQLHIRSDNGAAIGQILISNMQGQVMMNKYTSATMTDIELSNLPKEMLFVRIARGGAIVTKKITNL